MPTPHRLFFSILLALLMSQSVISLVNAEPDRVSYMLDEPVFKGQSYIVEAGREHQQMIVLVHGLGDIASDTWNEIIPQLARHYHVVSFDLPGFGRSSKHNALYSPDNYAAFIDFLVSKLGQQQFMLVGHSLGGNIALRYATMYPHKVSRLMLIDAAGVLHRIAYSNFLAHFGIKLLPQFYPQQSEDIQSITNLLIGQIAARNGFLDMGEKMLLNDPRLRQTILGGEPSAIAAYAMIMTDYSGLLRPLQVPTLILWGKQDQVIPLRTGKVLATNLPHAGLVVFDETGHSPMHEKPARFNSWLKRFTDSSDSEFARLLETTRYAIDDKVENNSERIIHCQNQDNQLYVGDFKLMIIDNCQNVEIDSARIKSLSIKNSQVTMNNSMVNSEGKAVFVQDASLQINGCSISGSPALAFNRARLDIAGSELLSRTGAAIQNLASQREPAINLPLPAPMSSIEQHDTILFSMTHLSSRYTNKELHGPVNIEPKQTW